MIVINRYPNRRFIPHRLEKIRLSIVFHATEKASSTKPIMGGIAAPKCVKEQNDFKRNLLIPCLRSTYRYDCDNQQAHACFSTLFGGYIMNAFFAPSHPFAHRRFHQVLSATSGDSPRPRSVPPAKPPSAV